MELTHHLSVELFTCDKAADSFQCERKYFSRDKMTAADCMKRLREKSVGGDEIKEARNAKEMNFHFSYSFFSVMNHARMMMEI